MKGLINKINKIRPSFEKGGKFGALHSTFDAFASFMLVPDTVTKSGSHIRDCVDLKRIMSIMIFALLPALLFGIWNTGDQHSLAFGLGMSFWGKVWYGFIKLLPLILVSYIVGLAIEFISAQINGHEVNEGYLVTGMLIPLVMPIDVPLWILALSVIFAVVIGKEVFGGTGMNIWNPTLLARAFVFFAYPSHISGDSVWVAGLANHSAQLVDGFSGATPLAQASSGIATPGFMQMFIGNIPGSVGETSTIAILIGAAILIYTGVASWKIMVSCLAGALAVGLLANGLATPGTYAAYPVWNHLVMGGFAFGTVFMATDPVTSAQTETGKWIYGFLIGAMVIVLRLFNPGYKEGMMLAILLMNTFAPLIDYYVVESNIKKRMKRAVIK
ncbi:MAG: NADH:ubiquinone reductase (Na(+)-transporting) subunit B [Bacteroidales bacterium]|jgi:Na+-transporting NADH:ubiquinone oxidoreductase subunit B|nr:NADH:ubiquinone reductase (Na(+)-transporting) subunit B [Bacteroidales bacterium]